jgi:hypothetical protein
MPVVEWLEGIVADFVGEVEEEGWGSDAHGALVRTFQTVGGGLLVWVS